MSRRPTDSSLAGRAAGSLLPAWALLALSLLVMPALALRSPSAGEEIALLFPPGTAAQAAMAAVAAADGLAVRQGGAGNLLVARFARDLGWRGVWQLGALAALDPAVAGACAALLKVSADKGAPT